MQEMFKPAMDNLYASGYNFIDLDSLGWGVLDMFVVVHSGDPAESGIGSGDCNAAPPEQRIWSQGISGSANGWHSSDFSYQVSNYLLVGSFSEPACGGVPVELGVIAHEYMHGFGLIDMYDEDFEEEKIDLGGTGKFSIMSNP
jgi:M6 family metalloprotease-like protein